MTISNLKDSPISNEHINNNILMKNNNFDYVTENLLNENLKNSQISNDILVEYFKKRAIIEREYGNQLRNLSTIFRDNVSYGKVKSIFEITKNELLTTANIRLSLSDIINTKFEKSITELSSQQNEEYNKYFQLMEENKKSVNESYRNKEECFKNSFGIINEIKTQLKEYKKDHDNTNNKALEESFDKEKQLYLNLRNSISKFNEIKNKWINHHKETTESFIILEKECTEFIINNLINYLSNFISISQKEEEVYKRVKDELNILSNFTEPINMPILSESMLPNSKDDENIKIICKEVENLELEYKNEQKMKKVKKLKKKQKSSLYVQNITDNDKDEDDSKDIKKDTEINGVNNSSEGNTSSPSPSERNSTSREIKNDTLPLTESPVEEEKKDREINIIDFDMDSNDSLKLIDFDDLYETIKNFDTETQNKVYASLKRGQSLKSIIAADDKLKTSILTNTLNRKKEEKKNLDNKAKEKLNNEDKKTESNENIGEITTQIIINSPSLNRSELNNNNTNNNNNINTNTNINTTNTNNNNVSPLLIPPASINTATTTPLTTSPISTSTSMTNGFTNTTVTNNSTPSIHQRQASSNSMVGVSSPYTKGNYYYIHEQQQQQQMSPIQEPRVQHGSIKSNSSSHSNYSQRLSNPSPSNPNPGDLQYVPKRGASKTPRNRPQSVVYTNVTLDRQQNRQQLKYIPGANSRRESLCCYKSPKLQASYFTPQLRESHPQYGTVKSNPYHPTISYNELNISNPQNNRTMGTINESMNGNIQQKQQSLQSIKSKSSIKSAVSKHSINDEPIITDNMTHNPIPYTQNEYPLMKNNNSLGCNYDPYNISIVKPILFYVRVLYDYDSTIYEEITIRKDMVIPILETQEDGWWEGEIEEMGPEGRRRRRGLLPSNFVEIIKKI